MNKNNVAQNNAQAYGNVNRGNPNGISNHGGRSASHISGVHGGHQSSSDRRDANRASYNIEVGVASDHRLFVGLVSNISAGGLFIATQEELRKGDKVDVQFKIPSSSHVFQKTAVVCWTRPYDNEHDGRGRAGAGVQLEQLTDEEQNLLNSFLKDHDAIFFDL